MKKIIKKIFHTFGLDVHRLNPSSNHAVQLLAALNYVHTNIVFDIGANVGQFAKELRSVGFSGRIVSFDPLSEAHKKLSKSARNDNDWFVHSRAALGDHDGNIEINIAGNSVSSSVLPMLDAHSSAAIGSAYVAKESVPLVRLDTVAESYLSSDSCLFIKIDTQGFEAKVLDGASETLKRAHGLLIELSLTPLYEGQMLWLDLIDRMEEIGFTLWAIQNGFTDPHTGRTLQIDGIFIRTEKINK